MFVKINIARLVSVVVASGALLACQPEAVAPKKPTATLTKTVVFSDDTAPKPPREGHSGGGN